MLFKFKVKMYRTTYETSEEFVVEASNAEVAVMVAKTLVEHDDAAVVWDDDCRDVDFGLDSIELVPEEKSDAQRTG
jgi:hypothetical protein